MCTVVSQIFAAHLSSGIRLLLSFFSTRPPRARCPTFRRTFVCSCGFGQNRPSHSYSTAFSFFFRETDPCPKGSFRTLQDLGRIRSNPCCVSVKLLAFPANVPRACPGTHCTCSLHLCTVPSLPSGLMLANRSLIQSTLDHGSSSALFCHFFGPNFHSCPPRNSSDHRQASLSLIVLSLLSFYN